MAEPAFQIIEDLFSDGAYGSPDSASAGYGLVAYGGPAYPPYTLPMVTVGSDEPQENRHRVRAGITHKRDGVIIGARTRAVRRRWRLLFDKIDSTDVDELAAFFDIGRFRFLPTGEGGSEILVAWTETVFKPDRHRGATGYYTLGFTIEEVPSTS